MTAKPTEFAFSLRGFCLAAGLCMILVSLFVAQERYFPYWDSRGYLEAARQLAQSFVHHPQKALDQILASIRSQDYNLLAVTPVAGLLATVPFSRLAHVLALVVCWLLPAGVALAAVGRRLAPWPWPTTSSPPPLPWLVWFLPALLCPLLWLPTLRNMPDVAGLLPLAGVLLLWRQPDQPGWQWPRWLAMGLLLGVMYLLRRWFAYWVVAFFVSAGLLALASAITSTGWRGLRHSLARLVVAGGSAVALVSLLGWPKILEVLRTDYSAAYEAYQMGQNYGHRLLSAVMYTGAYPLALALVGWGLALARSTQRHLAWVVVASSCGAVLLFSRVQMVSPQHLLLWAPAVVLGCGLALAWLWRNLARLCQPLAWAALLLVGLPPLALQLAPQLLPDIPGWIYGTTDLTPWRRSNYDQVAALARNVAALAPGNQRVYLVCSSHDINEDVLRSALQERTAKPPHSVFWTAEVDGRDGPPRQLFQADLVLVCDPVQYHLRPEDQQLVAVTATTFLEGTGVARHYRRLEQEWLLDGVRVVAFRPLNPVPAEEQDAFLGSLPPQVGTPTP